MRENNALLLCISVLVIGAVIFGCLTYVANAAPDTALHHMVTALWVLYTLPLTAATIALLSLGVRRLKCNYADRN